MRASPLSVARAVSSTARTDTFARDGREATSPAAVVCRTSTSPRAGSTAPM